VQNRKANDLADTVILPKDELAARRAEKANRRWTPQQVARLLKAAAERKRPF
jgi:hypothetical protein